MNFDKLSRMHVFSSQFIFQIVLFYTAVFLSAYFSRLQNKFRKRNYFFYGAENNLSERFDVNFHIRYRKSLFLSQAISPYINMAERNDCFWNEDESKLREFQCAWLDDIEKNEKKKKKDKSRKSKKIDKDYSMDGELNQRVEKNIGCKVALVGPMVDKFLKHAAVAMHRKLGRGSLTGLSPPINICVPWQIMRSIASMATSYGADLKVVNKDKTKRKEFEKMLIWLEENSSKKIFNPSRFDGTNFLAKRKFRRMVNVESGKRELIYAGEARVVVSKYTPIHMEYVHKDSSLRISFYVQRYTNEGFAVDASLQKLMNTDAEANENIFDDEKADDN